MNYGYARVSAADQNLSRQIESFLSFGIEEKNVFCDKKSGKDFDRLQYKVMIKRLKKGDLLVIKSIDRLGRNYGAIIAEWTRITKTIGADILVLDMPLLDTRSKKDNLIGRFISDIVLQILSFVAENERVNIKARQAEGIASAKKAGVIFGRPRKNYSKELLLTLSRYKENKITLNEALKLTNMKRSNFYYHLSKVGNSLI